MRHGEEKGGETKREDINVKESRGKMKGKEKMEDNKIITNYKRLLICEIW